MKISETTLPFLEADCLQTFGKEKGTILFQQTETIYQRLCQGADDHNNAVIRHHLQNKLLPPLAYYQALRATGFDQEKALAYVRAETHKAAQIKKAAMKKLANLPLAYTIYRLSVKKFMKKNFPEEGWQTQWVRCDGQEIHFNLHRCLYWEWTQTMHCPELCSVYCENDVISFSGLLPKIRFERTGTLGEGAAYCDFHFFKAT